MALVSMLELLDHAAANGYGIPAFNVNNLEQVQAVMAAADEVGAPVILQASAGARKYAGESFIKHLIQAAVEAYPHIPLVMHQDHGQSPAICQGAIDLGFSSVMMDGSLEEDGKTPASFEYNVDVTRRVVALAHRVGVTVEGELGCLGSLETGEAGEEDGIGAVGKLHARQIRILLQLPELCNKIYCPCSRQPPIDHDVDLETHRFSHCHLVIHVPARSLRTPDGDMLGCNNDVVAEHQVICHRDSNFWRDEVSV